LVQLQTGQHPGLAAGSPGPLPQEPAPGSDQAINQRIFETSLDLILVVDRGGTFLRVSPSSEAILGYRPRR
jgi:PAS domain-containing protein